MLFCYCIMVWRTAISDFQLDPTSKSSFEIQVPTRDLLIGIRPMHFTCQINMNRRVFWSSSVSGQCTQLIELFVVCFNSRIICLTVYCTTKMWFVVELSQCELHNTEVVHYLTDDPIGSLLHGLSSSCSDIWSCSVDSLTSFLHFAPVLKLNWIVHFAPVLKLNWIVGFEILRKLLCTNLIYTITPSLQTLTTGSEQLGYKLDTLFYNK